METKYTEAALDLAKQRIDHWGTLRDVVEGLRRDIADNFAILTPELRLEEGDDNCVEIADSWVSPCLLYTSPSPRDRQKSRMPSSA